MVVLIGKWTIEGVVSVIWFVSGIIALVYNMYMALNAPTWTRVVIGMVITLLYGPIFAIYHSHENAIFGTNK